MVAKRTRKSTGNPGRYVGSTDLAELLGVTNATIGNWRKAGMPVHRKTSSNNYEYDTAAVYQWRIKYESDLVHKQYDDERRELEQKYASAPVGTTVAPMTIVEAKTRKEVAAALQAELELAKALEQVANIDDLMANFTDALVEVRAKLTSMSNRLGGILAHQAEDAVRELIDNDVAEMLESLSGYKHKYVEGMDCE